MTYACLDTPQERVIEILEVTREQFASLSPLKTRFWRPVIFSPQPPGTIQDGWDIKSFSVSPKWKAVENE